MLPTVFLMCIIAKIYFKMNVVHAFEQRRRHTRTKTDELPEKIELTSWPEYKQKYTKRKCLIFLLYTHLFNVYIY